MSHATVDVLVDAGALLGEGPRWCAKRERLLWLDIDSRAVHETDLADGGDRSDTIDASPGALATRAGDGLVIAASEGFMAYEPDGGPLELLAEHGGAPDEVMNDGVCDPAGRLWAGTYAVGERPGGGRLVRFDPDHSVTQVLEGVTLSNGMGWSPDGRRMYYIDSLTQCVDVFDYDVSSGEATERRTLVAVAESEGTPDGLAVDHDGCLWVALWGGGEVRRYTPDGELDQALRVPTRHVTACAFGGTEGDTLLITTASGYLDPAARAEEPHAGAVFAARPGATGPPTQPFGG